jgi:hypothetical protein
LSARFGRETIGVSPDIEEVAIILDAARALRAYLPELVGPDRAAPLDRELAELLERPGDEDVPDRLAAIFEREERVHVWVAEYFTYGAPGDVAETERVASLPGVPRPPGPERYACAHGDFVFYRRTVAALVPECPTHRTALVLAPAPA